MNWACPKCSSKALDVYVSTWARLFQRKEEMETDIYDAEDRSQHWDDDSMMKCRNVDCRYVNQSKRFKRSETPRAKPPAGAVCPNCGQDVDPDVFLSSEIPRRTTDLGNK